MRDLTPAEQFEALTEEQKAEVAAAVGRTLSEIGKGVAQAFTAFSAALAPFARQCAEFAQALGVDTDQGSGAVWSQLMADIDELTRDRPVSEETDA